MTLSKKSADTGRAVPPYNLTDLADMASTNATHYTQIYTASAAPPSPAELVYILIKLKKSLRRHDDGSVRIADLREGRPMPPSAYEAKKIKTQPFT